MITQKIYSNGLFLTVDASNDVALDLETKRNTLESKIHLNLKKLITNLPTTGQTFIKNSQQLYFLIAHGQISNQNQWTFYDENKILNLQDYLNQRLPQITEQKGIIYICNPNQHQIQTPTIPLLYPITNIGIGIKNFSEQNIKITTNKQK